ncbi:MAG: VWA domain-containing protein [Bryobacteraceae bacterium]
MTIVRCLIAGLLAVSLLAQQEEAPDQVFRATVNVVTVPVTVTDRDGRYVNGLQPSNFRLLDNNKPQDIKVDVSFVPISLVVAIQSSWETQSILPKIRKIGPLLQGLLTGEQGEIAVLSYAHRIDVLQDFTSDSDSVDAALEKLKVGASSNRVIDASMTGIRMLSRRPANRRRILLIIGETRDRSSEGRIRDTLTMAQLENVLVYTVNLSRLMATLTAKPQPPRPDPIPSTARPMPGMVVPTPENARAVSGLEGTSINFLPLFVEIFRSVKAIFVDNPAEVLTDFTGGREFGFDSIRDLERAISQIGEEVHSQYIVNYSPNNKVEGGFHEIKVQVFGSTGAQRRDLKVVTRPGYWLAAVPE